MKGFVFDLDNTLVLLLFIMYLNRKNADVSQVAGIMRVMGFFLLVTFIGLVLEYQSIVYYLWGMRNNIRFFVFFLMCAMVMKQDDADTCMRLLDGLFYVNDTVTVKTGANSTQKPNGVIISGDDEALMYKDGFTFMVNGVEIKLKADATNPTATKLDDGTTSAKTETLKTTPAIYYYDERNAEPAEGIESKWIYQDDTKGGETTLPGVDKVE